jgi:penicillin-binding protein 1B
MPGKKKSSTDNAPSRQKASGKKSFGRKLLSLAIKLSIIITVLLAGYLIFLDIKIIYKFEGKKWSLPAHVYARTLELYHGAPYTKKQLTTELELLGYQQQKHLDKPGSYHIIGPAILVHKRAFNFPDGTDPSRQLKITFSREGVDRITAEDEQAADLIRFEPLHIGGIYPRQAEDRILLQLQDVPEILINSLISVEDKTFYSHYGVSPRAIARALATNIKAGKRVQGGSTLTQQLVKNFYLSSDRKFSRKINEAFMSLLLELHYGKPEILETYLNEIYLGQSGDRAIHGFGLASYFYFERPLNELNTSQIALLIGMVKGPSTFNPRRNPDKATSRRNLVIDIMLEDEIITPEQAKQARQAPLGVTRYAATGPSRYPAFMELVRSQLKQNYQQEDLESEGLKIFTTLDPLVQDAAEEALEKRLSRIEIERKLVKKSLQGAVIISSSDAGEVLALVGGREARYSSFNRALNAHRQVGSLLKPAIFTTALSQPEKYSMLTLLDDSPLQVRGQNGQVWEPQNYDNEFHGWIPLYYALAKSYNVASARLGLELGLENVLDTLTSLGISRKLPTYPSVLLGAAELTPIEVMAMYQTLAANGFHTPIRVIRSVLDVDNNILNRYPIRLQQVIDPAVAYLTTASMIEVMRNGTGQSFYSTFPQSTIVAGKTGTSNNFRDSWFAGFSNDKLGIIWVGNDDNEPTGLTGSSGALRVWTDIMKQTGIQSLRLAPPDNIEFAWIEQSSGRLAAEYCEGVVQFPFIRGSLPLDKADCIRDGASLGYSIRKKVKSIWQRLVGE